MRMRIVLTALLLLCASVAHAQFDTGQIAGIVRDRIFHKMEESDVLTLFTAPKSAYTRALLSALPENATGDRLPTIGDYREPAL